MFQRIAALSIATRITLETTHGHLNELQAQSHSLTKTLLQQHIGSSKPNKSRSKWTGQTNICAELDKHVDEDGYFPQMFGLSEEDPEVEDIFGPQFAARLRAPLPEQSAHKAATHTGIASAATSARITSSPKLVMDSKGCAPDLRRLTRRSACDKFFYELDSRGQARLLGADAGENVVFAVEH
ncbi:hypothetical protein DHEL01_v211441 [Diaporthe helianthi]|uniref:Uncharacterized protein n=1 Tax=Diaporthe helianthi TaxID=158607 RepID=A0A2P5HIU4_DIAHE|nr:hypothetical protein DHEL01_v211441 [Diaporthe helianthi]